jgi:membrane protease YdiL (CAAX protease family)
MALQAVVRRFPLASFFVLAYAVSLISLVVLGPPSLAPGGHRNLVSLALFPMMVIWVGVSGILLTAAEQGPAGLRDLRRRMTRWKVGAGWYAAAILIPPAVILLTLGLLTGFVSRSFTPNLYPIGISYGILAGFFEEIGWSGYAYPRLHARLGAQVGSVLLGLLWGVWHLPVVDSLGAASPHGPAWPAFFAAFVALVAGLRVLICWVYSNTDSVLLAQIMHASNTGFLVVLGAAAVSPAQEAVWYALDAGALWTIAAALLARNSFPARARPGPAQ